jgi:hypothetical protein
MTSNDALEVATGRYCGRMMSYTANISHVLLETFIGEESQDLNRPIPDWQ